MGLIWGVVMWRIVRRPERTTAFAHAQWWSGAVVGAVVVLAWFGSLRYGSPGPPGLVAALADVPVIPANPVVSRASLLLGVTMVGWAIAASRWARSRTVAPRLPWLLLGVGLLATVTATLAAMAGSYGSVGIPTAMALVAAIPVLGVLVLSARST